jgi:tripartite-type tricarboxylate transporter receptor subunit TctC
LLFTPAGSFTVHPLQYSKLPYVPEDLVPIARVSNTILAIGVPTSLKIGSLAEFVKYARAEPGKLNAAVVAGITEFTFDYFLKTAGLSIAKVPYRDVVQAATDLSEGRLQVMMSSYAILQPRVQAGSVRALAVNGHERASILPDIPTARESGFPALEVEGLVGLLGPRGISNELRRRIGADVAAVAGDPTIAERLAGTAQVANPGGPAEFAAAIDQQRAQIATIAQALGPIPKQ